MDRGHFMPKSGFSVLSPDDGSFESSSFEHNSSGHRGNSSFENSFEQGFSLSSSGRHSHSSHQVLSPTREALLEHNRKSSDHQGGDQAVSKL